MINSLVMEVDHEEPTDGIFKTGVNEKDNSVK